MPTVDLQNDPFLTHTQPAGTRLDPTRTQALQSRRQMGSASSLQQKYNRRKWVSQLQGKREGPTWMLLFGAVCPTFMFLLIVAEFTFDFVLPAFVWAITLVLFVILVYLAWPLPPPLDFESPDAAIQNQKRPAWQWFPIGSLIFACVMGYIFGGTNYYIFMLPYLHYSFNREYTNVNPGESADGFRDAGAVYFSASSRVNLAQSVGFKDWNRFCVAPVVGDDPSDTVSFFAAGLDCCGSRHDFNCWEASDPNAHAGVRISENDPLGNNLPQFKKAAAMAASVYGFKTAENPILVLWVKDPHVFAQSTFWVAMVFLMVSAVIGFCGMCCCITGLKHLRAI